MDTQNFNPLTDLTNFFKNVDYEKLLGYAGGGLEAIKNFAVTGSKETTRVMLELYFVMMSEQTSKFDKFLMHWPISCCRMTSCPKVSLDF